MNLTNLRNALALSEELAEAIEGLHSMDPKDQRLLDWCDGKAVELKQHLAGLLGRQEKAALRGQKTTTPALNLAQA